MALSEIFSGLGACDNSAKRPAPFSLRLTAAERNRLTEDAAGLPLGSYIKAKLFDQESASIRRRPSGMAVEDRQALAQALALLGQTRYASNLNQLAHLANMGALPLTPEVIEELENTLRLIGEVRGLILQAVGCRKTAE
jgi:hypothetical protein